MISAGSTILSGELLAIGAGSGSDVLLMYNGLTNLIALDMNALSSNMSRDAGGHGGGNGLGK
jgi:hypothetical protein